MQTRPNAYRPARPSRLVATLISVVLSTAVLGAVLAGFAWQSAGTGDAAMAQAASSHLA